MLAIFVGSQLKCFGMTMQLKYKPHTQHKPQLLTGIPISNPNVYHEQPFNPATPIQTIISHSSQQQ
jgi:hypothetical protein